jgi:hypothetical protein
MKNIRTPNTFYSILFIAIIHSSANVYSQTQGPLNPRTLINDVSSGAIPWNNAGNGSLSDNIYTSATNGTSQILNVSNFGFSIPGGASITGILAEVKRKALPVSPVSSGTWTTFRPPAYSSGTATANYGSTSYSYNLPVSSATNNRRLLVVTIGVESVDNGAPLDPTVTFTTVTYNGVPLTLASTSSLGSTTTVNKVAVYYLLESGLPATTGINTLVINKTINGESAGGTVSPGEYVEVVGVATFTNVNQETPVTSVSATSTTTTVTSPTISNSRNGDYILAATMNNTSSGGSVTQATGYTENFEIAHNNTAGATSGAILEVQSRSVSGTGSPNVTVSATGTGASRLAMVALAVNAARVYDNGSVLTNPAGKQVGNNKAMGPVNTIGNAWPDTDIYQSYGGTGDLWGSTWTSTDINSTYFGLSFQVAAENSIAFIDHVRLTVYYNIPLGVTIQSFSVTQVNGQVVSNVSFNTDDSKKYFFTLEKAGSDFQFEPVTDFVITGNSGMQQLSMKDANPDQTIIYYRVKVVEEGKENAVQYSFIRHIDFFDEELELTIYPNPASEYFVVHSNQLVTSIRLTDVAGKEILVVVNSDGINEYRIENIFAQGLYTLIINTNTGTIVKKIEIN